MSYSQLRKYNNVLADIRKISSFYEKSCGNQRLRIS
jgi:hypothetical protein